MFQRSIKEGYARRVIGGGNDLVGAWPSVLFGERCWQLGLGIDLYLGSDTPRSYNSAIGGKCITPDGPAKIAGPALHFAALAVHPVEPGLSIFVLSLH